MQTKAKTVMLPADWESLQKYRRRDNIFALVSGAVGGVFVAIIGIASDLNFGGWMTCFLIITSVVVLIGFADRGVQHEKRARVQQAQRDLELELEHAARRAREEAEKAEENRARALVMSQVDKMSGIEFEQYLQRVLRNRGYQAELTKASNDLGVDIILTKDGEKIAVQVKRYATAISRRAISDAVAGMQHYRCSKAMVVTSNYYTKGAETLAESTGCLLVDRTTLAQWIFEYSQGLEPQSYTEHKIILCPRCRQQLRVPLLRQQLRVRCYTCRHQFLFSS